MSRFLPGLRKEEASEWGPGFSNRVRHNREVGKRSKRRIETLTNRSLVYSCLRRGTIMLHCKMTFLTLPKSVPL
jgi:hypothetical protein